MFLNVVLAFLLCLEVAICTVSSGGMLFPRDSETRQSISLDGLWNFVLAPIYDPLLGFRELWYKKDLRKVNIQSVSEIVRQNVTFSCIQRFIQRLLSLSLSRLFAMGDFVKKLLNVQIYIQSSRLSCYILMYFVFIFQLSGNIDVHMMPVPSSYNDITVDPKIRDHLGLVWYDRRFFVPKAWGNCSRTWIRFSGVSYASQVVRSRVSD